MLYSFEHPIWSDVQVESCLFFGNDLLRLWHQSIQYNLSLTFVLDLLTLVMYWFCHCCMLFFLWMWWLRAGSMGLAILLFVESCCGLLWEQSSGHLCLLGPVLLECCQFQLSSLSSMIVLQPLLQNNAKNQKSSDYVTLIHCWYKSHQENVREGAENNAHCGVSTSQAYIKSQR